ncbi:MAG TPA: DNA polymerase III subunit delta [Streptosporangiaceae bacterium]|jgi:DNA polymerase-3 subunit delta
MATTGTAPNRGSQAEAVCQVTVIVGEEDLLVERALRAAVRAAAQGGSGGPGGGTEAAHDDSGAAGHAGTGAPGADVHDVRAAELTAGQLTMLTSPSLFGGTTVVIIRAAQDATKELAAQLASLAAAAEPDVLLVLTHAGGAKGKALLAELAKAGAARIDCPAVRRFGERMDFLRGEFRRAGRRADDSGLRALLDTVGTDLRELAAACSQLAADTTGLINQQVVSRYYRGRADASGFSVADRAFEGKLAESLEQLRWALATGTSPVLITSALAQGARSLGRVGSARGTTADALAAETGLPPWKVDRVRQQLRGWTPEGVARAHSVIAQTDADVKGEAVSAEYALERAIRTIVDCRGRS